LIEFEKRDNKKVRRNTSVLVEKYRPLSVKNVIIPERYKKMFQSFIDEQEIQNMILHSNSPGVGKTTIAKALADDCNYTYLYINTSLHSGIDTLRTEIANFATVKSISGRSNKVVILDEFDYASPNLQAGLRGAMEEYYNKCRFIITANYINKIIKPLHSRSQVINFDFTEADKIALKPLIVKRLQGICKKENIQYEDGVMDNIVDAFYPDIRQMINNISEYSRQYDIIDESIFNFTKIDDEVTKLITNLDLKGTRQYILDNNYKFEDMYRHFFDKVIPVVDANIRVELYKLTSEYLDMSTRSWDQEITFVGFLATFMEIMDNYGE
jgi:DNA polymerase III delta prime subunit